MGNSSSQSVTSCGTEAAATGKTVSATVSTITTGQNRTLSKGRSFMKFGRRLTSINSKDVSAAAAENLSNKHHSADDDFCNILIPKAGQSDNEITVKPAGLGDVKKKVKKKSADFDNIEVQDDTSTVNNAKEICLYEFLKEGEIINEVQQVNNNNNASNNKGLILDLDNKHQQQQHYQLELNKSFSSNSASSCSNNSDSVISGDSNTYSRSNFNSLNLINQTSIKNKDNNSKSTINNRTIKNSTRLSKKKSNKNIIQQQKLQQQQHQQHDEQVSLNYEWTKAKSSIKDTVTSVVDDLTSLTPIAVTGIIEVHNYIPTTNQLEVEYEQQQQQQPERKKLIKNSSIRPVETGNDQRRSVLVNKKQQEQPQQSCNKNLININDKNLALERSCEEIKIIEASPATTIQIDNQLSIEGRKNCKCFNNKKINNNKISDDPLLLITDSWRTVRKYGRCCSEIVQSQLIDDDNSYSDVCKNNYVQEKLLTLNNNCKCKCNTSDGNNIIIREQTTSSSSDSIFTDPLTTPIGFTTELNLCYYSEENVCDETYKDKKLSKLTISDINYVNFNGYDSVIDDTEIIKNNNDISELPLNKINALTDVNEQSEQVTTTVDVNKETVNDILTKSSDTKLIKATIDTITKTEAIANEKQSDLVEETNVICNKMSFNSRNKIVPINNDKNETKKNKNNYQNDDRLLISVVNGKSVINNNNNKNNNNLNGKQQQTPIKTDKSSIFNVSRVKKVELQDIITKSPDVSVGNNSEITSPTAVKPSTPLTLPLVNTLNDEEALPSIPITPSSTTNGGNVLKKVATYTVTKQPGNLCNNLLPHIKRPTFVPEKLIFGAYENFEGQMLMNWFIATLQTSSTSVFQLTDNEFNILTMQYCTNLLMAGVIKQVEDRNTPIQDTFLPNLMYQWTFTEQITTSPFIGKKLETNIIWPHHASTAPSTPICKEINCANDLSKERQNLTNTMESNTNSTIKDINNTLNDEQLNNYKKLINKCITVKELLRLLQIIERENETQKLVKLSEAKNTLVIKELLNATDVTIYENDLMKNYDDDDAADNNNKPAALIKSSTPHKNIIGDNLSNEAHQRGRDILKQFDKNDHGDNDSVNDIDSVTVQCLKCLKLNQMSADNRKNIHTQTDEERRKNASSMTDPVMLIEKKSKVPTLISMAAVAVSVPSEACGKNKKVIKAASNFPPPQPPPMTSANAVSSLSGIQTLPAQTCNAPPPPPPPPPPPMLAFPAENILTLAPPPPPPPPLPFGMLNNSAPPPPPPPPSLAGSGPPPPPPPPSLMHSSSSSGAPPPPPPMMMANNGLGPPAPPPTAIMVDGQGKFTTSTISSSASAPNANAAGKAGVGPPPLPMPPAGIWEQATIMRKKAVNPPKPMRPLYWTRIVAPRRTEVDAPIPVPVATDGISQKTELWQEIDETNLDNLDEFTELFSRQVIAPKVKEQAPKPIRVKAIKVLDSKRSQNVGIFARSLHVDFHEIEHAIYHFDTSVINMETLQHIMEIQATSEELSQIKDAAQDDAPLDMPEQFLLKVANISSSAERISCILFQSDFEEGSTIVLRKIKLVKQLCEFLNDNENLKMLFSIILTLGNYMNGGNRTRGQADGFGLEILGKLKDVKSTNSKITLLHFIVKTYIAQRRKEGVILTDVQLPIPEPGDIDKSVAIDFEECKAQINLLQNKLNVCNKTTEKVIAASTAENLQPFKEKMETFTLLAEKQINNLEKKLNDCQIYFLKTIKFYKFIPKTGKLENCTPGQFFEQWTSFTNDFRDIWKMEMRYLSDEIIKKAKQTSKPPTSTKMGKLRPSNLKERMQRVNSKN